MNICIILINNVFRINTSCKIYEKLFHIGIPEVSFYYTLTYSSKNDIRNGHQAFASSDHKMK